MSRVIGLGVFLLVSWLSISSTSAQCVGNEPPFFPHPTDCHFFYVCTNGEAVLQECSLDLWFNPNTNQCDFPGSFCVPGGGGSTTGGPTTSPGPGYPMPCPGTDPIRYPHASDCNLYYLCVSGSPVLHRCQDGFHLNPLTRTCELIALAGCDVCPATDVDGVTVRLPHVDTCNLYYRCDAGVPSLFQCPVSSGAFSSYDRVCYDIAANAYCYLPN